MNAELKFNQNLKGISVMIIGMVGMAGTDACGKWLMTNDYSVFQLIAVRGWIIVALMSTWIFLTKVDFFDQTQCRIKDRAPWCSCYSLGSGFWRTAFDVHGSG